MKILLIMPDAHMHKLCIGGFKKSFREAPLTLSVLAALIPEKHEIKIIDESIEDIPYDYPADLVGISLLTGTSLRGYRISKIFRSKGVKVVLGGVHVTILPREAEEHADSIVIGMAEKTWPKLIEDFERGELKKVYKYKDNNNEIIISPLPRMDLIKRSGYMVPDAVHATRGCSYSCDFCSATAVWPRHYKRPIADVVRDIKNLSGKMIALNDISLDSDPEYAKELFRAMIPLNKKWGGLASILVTKDDELLSLMRESGCVFLLIGLESNNQLTLNSIYKGFNDSNDYKAGVEKLHSNNISVQGCFVFGFDHDTRDVFQETIESVHDLKIDIPRYSIYTPYPGTKLFDRLHKENRIISYNWSDYDTMHVVYQPSQMSVEDLYTGFKMAYKETFRFRNILERTFYKKDKSCLVNFFGNLAYKIFVYRLYNDSRFSVPNNINDEIGA